MTLEEILNDIDKMLKDQQDQLDGQLMSALHKRREINKIIQSAAPYFKSQKSTQKKELKNQ